jgi:membrane associated rhomboid family serine protease
MTTPDLVRLIAVGGAVAAMLGGMWLTFERLKTKGQGFGPNSLKAVGLVIFIPSLVIIGVVIPNFQTETLAALLGTVAGYVLSTTTSEK